MQASTGSEIVTVVVMWILVLCLMWGFIWKARQTRRENRKIAKYIWTFAGIGWAFVIILVAIGTAKIHIFPND